MDGFRSKGLFFFVFVFVFVLLSTVIIPVKVYRYCSVDLDPTMEMLCLKSFD